MVDAVSKMESPEFSVMGPVGDINTYGRAGRTVKFTTLECTVPHAFEISQLYNPPVFAL
jgi:hypothetical protein